MKDLATRSAERRDRLERALQRFVASARTFPDVRAVYVFGSFARNEVGVRSDLDLLVIRDTTRRGPMRGEDLAVDALVGIECDLLVLTPAEFAQRGLGTTFWRAVIDEAKLVYAA
ncbi:MAG: hypothetical protein NVS2B8_17280 [Vulcanimicrobiaceae bacterium]